MKLSLFCFVEENDSVKVDYLIHVDYSRTKTETALAFRKFLIRRSSLFKEDECESLTYRDERL